jgi:hypothetical protein
MMYIHIYVYIPFGKESIPRAGHPGRASGRRGGHPGLIRNMKEKI